VPDETKQTFLGLNTDLPPDRLGRSAFQVLNMVPASEESVRPRFGETLVGHYTTETAGRHIYVDDLPFRSDGRLLLVVGRSYEEDEEWVHVAEGLVEYGERPNHFGFVETDPDDLPGTDWSGGGDTGLMAQVFGWSL
jgi:hypothetical protein